jgi:secretion/DNA translocation related TadE-like protein
MTGRRDGGSATVLALTVAGLVAAAAAMTAIAASAIAVRHRAGFAADAAALAAAAGLDGLAPCSAARRLAELNGADLSGCSVTGSVVTVSVRVAPTGVLRWLGAATAHARAGQIVSNTSLVGHSTRRRNLDVPVSLVR